MTEIILALKQTLTKNESSIQLPQACISIIFKLIEDKRLDVLFIKRSFSGRDKHSGQIAFPGGKIERGEKGYDAALRETFEEIGINLQDSEYIGHTDTIPAYQGGLRISSMLLTSYIFFIQNERKINLNTEEVYSYRWVDFDVFTKDLRSYTKPIYNSLAHNSFKTWLNQSGIISGYFPGVILPKSQFCTSNDYSEYHLWGATYRKMRNITMSLPQNLRTVEQKDWIYYDLDWPNKILNPVIYFIDRYIPDKLKSAHFVI